MPRSKRPLQTYFQINIRGTEDALPDASQLAAFVEAYNRLYKVLRIATDSDYDAEILLGPGYRLRQRDKLSVRSFRMSSPFHASLIVLAIPGAVAAVKYLVQLSLEVYKTKRDDPKILAETAKLEAEADEARARGRKADAEVRKSDAETAQILQDLSPVRVEEHGLVSARVYSLPDPELALERAKQITEEISRSLSPAKMPGKLDEIMTGLLPPQARLPIYRALTKMIKSSFVIVDVEIVATQIADGGDTLQSEE